MNEYNFRTVPQQEQLWAGYEQNGLREGFWHCYENKLLKRSVQYVHGARQGRGYFFDDAGKLRMILTFEQNRLHGQAKFFSSEEEHLATFKYIFDKLDEVLYYVPDKESPPKRKDFLPPTE
ncbi:toxin-antitoxin system YwqK family antitoxin [Chitinophaga vietnamensis]|uniref:hypothetical protein n=1 Tax=Chitinophaga vietnamensis TaxID=2593957 RepID=UPI0011788855|nr:hypothetical protein [Chitinophaga vietnamensis]